MMLKVFKCFSALLLFAMVACSNIEPQIAIPAIDDASQKILVVNTNAQVERYRVAERAFVSLFKSNEVESLDLATDSEPLELLLDQLNTGVYKAIYGIGAKSMSMIDYIGPELPVVYSSVLGWRKYQDRSEYFGVASEVSLVAQLTWFKHFFPDLKSIGVIYSEKNTDLILEAMQVAERLNISLRTKKVEMNVDIQSTAESLMNDVQALWLISDLNVFASERRVNKLFSLAKRKRVPVLTYNDFFIDLGALLSISADLPTTGRQAALKMKSILDKTPQTTSVVYPAGTRIILNQTVLEESGLRINEDALDALNGIRY